MSAVPVMLTPPLSDPAESAAKNVADGHRTHPTHSDALRLRAVSLWCEGLRSPAIARQLDVCERTIRAWLADARADFQADQGETAHEMIALAVERQLAIAAAAWQSYHHAVALEQLALDYHRIQAQRAHDNARALPPPPPRPSAAPARYLAVALAAQREAARLSGCYDVATAAAVAPPLAVPRSIPRASASPIPATTATTLSTLGPTPPAAAPAAPAAPAAAPADRVVAAGLAPAEPPTRPIPAQTVTAATGRGAAPPSTTGSGTGLAEARQAAFPSSVRVPAITAIHAPIPAATATAPAPLRTATATAPTPPEGFASPATTPASAGLAAGLQAAKPSHVHRAAESATAGRPPARPAVHVSAPHAWQQMK